MPDVVPTAIPGVDVNGLLGQLGRAAIGQATVVAQLDARVRVLEGGAGPVDWGLLVVAVFAFALGLVARRVADVVGGRRRVASVRVGDLGVSAGVGVGGSS